MHFRIALPTPFTVGTINAFAVKDGTGLVLIDAGPDTDEAWTLLLDSLASHGYQPSDIHAVLLTHGHEDHAGLAHRLRASYGTPVFAHAQEIPQLSPDGRQREISSRLLHQLLIQHGAPRSIVEYKDPRRENAPREGWRTEIDHPVEDGEQLSFVDARLTVLHTPGHTAGSTCYYHEASGTLFTGDHLIKGVIPNPGIEFPDGSLEGRTRSLPAYAASLEKVRALPVALVCPGHREEFADHRAEIDRLFRYFERGQKRALRLTDKGRCQAYGLVPPIAGPAHRMELFFFMYRSIGYFDLLESQGHVHAEIIGGQVYYTAARNRLKEERRQGGPDEQDANGP
jgi:glyoxylase-like metal-dependent hydrolase (beta-lactamase superfamily II)